MLLTDPTGRDPGDLPPPPERPKNLEDLGKRLDEIVKRIEALLSACACNPLDCGGTTQGTSKARRSPMGGKKSVARAEAKKEAETDAKKRLKALGNPVCTEQGAKCRCVLDDTATEVKCQAPKDDPQRGGGHIYTMTCKVTFSGTCKVG